MAKFSGTYKNKSIVSGMKIGDILNMGMSDFNKLNKADMQRIVGRLVSAGNKRIRNIQKKGAESGAVTAVMESGGLFTTRGKNLNQLRGEFIRAKGFLTDPRSSLKRSTTAVGLENVRKSTRKALESHGIKVNDEDTLTKMFRVLERVRKKDKKYIEGTLKYRVMDEITKELDDPNMTVDRAFQKIDKRLNTIYEEEQELTNEFEGTSGFIDV